MRELSIFVDESGDFGKYSHKSPYYIVTFVFHEQEYPINELAEGLDCALDYTKIGRHTIHSAPLIRRESIYRDLNVSDRLKIFDKLFYFTKKAAIKYRSIIVDKKHKEQIDVNNNISRELSNTIRDNLSYFQKFDKIIIYYDNGQRLLANILVSVFSSWFLSKFEYRVVSPGRYKLFQTADLICTLSLIEKKVKDGDIMTRSELKFFESYRNFKKNYIKHIKKLWF